MWPRLLPNGTMTRARHYCKIRRPTVVGHSFLIYGQDPDWRLAANDMKAINRSVMRGFTRSAPVAAREN